MCIQKDIFSKLPYRCSSNDGGQTSIDFRKEYSGSTKGRRFAKQGEDFIDDPDDIEVLRRFKDER